jgi:hypothetical protein
MKNDFKNGIRGCLLILMKYSVRDAKLTIAFIKAEKYKIVSSLPQPNQNPERTFIVSLFRRGLADTTPKLFTLFNIHAIS